jgi:hypothetical protein
MLKTMFFQKKAEPLDFSQQLGFLFSCLDMINLTYCTAVILIINYEPQSLAGPSAA